MYGDKITRSMQACLDETERRREKQLAYNQEHDITPQTIIKSMRSILDDLSDKDSAPLSLVAEEESRYANPEQLKKEIAKLKKGMLAAAADLEFEKAAELRDRVLALEKMELQI